MTRIVSIFLSIAIATVIQPIHTMNAAKQNVFTDIPSTHPLHKAIDFAVEENIISGYPDGTFRPEREISRVEFIKIAINALVAKAIKYGHKNSCTDQEVVDKLKFSDVDSQSWYASHLCLAVKDEATSGYPDGTFRPTDTVNFVEAAKIIALLRSTPQLLRISENTDKWYVPYVSFVSKHFNAIPPSIDRLDKNLTRGEVVEIMYRILNNKEVGLAKRIFNPETHSLILIEIKDVQGVIADPTVDSILGPADATVTIVLKQDLLQLSFSTHNYLVALNILEKYKPNVNLVIRPIARDITDHLKQISAICSDPSDNCPEGLRSPDKNYSKKLARYAICIKNNESDAAYWKFIDSFLKDENFTPDLNGKLKEMSLNETSLIQCVNNKDTKYQYNTLEKKFSAYNNVSDDVIFFINNTTNTIFMDKYIILEEDAMKTVEALLQN